MVSAASESVSPDSRRAISASRSSPSRRRTLEGRDRAIIGLHDRQVIVRERIATCARCVTAMTCDFSASRASRRPLRWPRSLRYRRRPHRRRTSGPGSVAAMTTSIASITRDSSPPEAPLRRSGAPHQDAGRGGRMRRHLDRGCSRPPRRRRPRGAHPASRGRAARRSRLRRDGRRRRCATRSARRHAHRVRRVRGVTFGDETFDAIAVVVEFGQARGTRLPQRESLVEGSMRADQCSERRSTLFDGGELVGARLVEVGRYADRSPAVSAIRYPMSAMLSPISVSSHRRCARAGDAPRRRGPMRRVHRLRSRARHARERPRGAALRRFASRSARSASS